MACLVAELYAENGLPEEAMHLLKNVIELAELLFGSLNDYLARALVLSADLAARLGRREDGFLSPSFTSPSGLISCRHLKL